MKINFAAGYPRVCVPILALGRCSVRAPHVRLDQRQVLIIDDGDEPLCETDNSHRYSAAWIDWDRAKRAFLSSRSVSKVTPEMPAAADCSTTSAQYSAGIE